MAFPHKPPSLRQVSAPAGTPAHTSNTYAAARVFACLFRAALLGQPETNSIIP